MFAKIGDYIINTEHIDYFVKSGEQWLLCMNGLKLHISEEAVDKIRGVQNGKTTEKIQSKPKSKRVRG